MSRSGTPLGLFVCGGPERGAGSFGDSTFFCTRDDHRFVFASEGDRQDSDLDRTSSMTMSAGSNQSIVINRLCREPTLRPNDGNRARRNSAKQRYVDCSIMHSVRVFWSMSVINAGVAAYEGPQLYT